MALALVINLKICFCERGKEQKKNRSPSSILHEAKLAYYARNMFEAARLVFS